MPKYYGCPCEGCGKPLTLQDDIVVCPDCGAPYHRVCYEKLGQCIHRPAHAAGYEWKFPYEESQLRTCPSCGERTLRDEETCRCCGAVLPPEGQEPPSSRGSGEETFDYSQMYRQFGTSADPEKEFFEDAFGKEAKMDGIDRQDWLDYIGPAAPAYLAAYSRMQLQKSKVSMSFSALLFGPFYFFYRKAWKPAFAFLAAELVLAHGIPAGPIMNIKEILDDPHVKEREMFVEMDHPTLGKVTVNGCAIKLMDTKPSVRTPAPQLGQNNRDIFEGVLGMTEEQFNALHEKQVF